jgi:ribosomal-protein-alanine N-acetyltransferase
MSDVQIIKMSEKHLAPVVVIENNVFRDPWTAESFVEVMALSPYCWVAMSGEMVVGYLLTQWVLDEVHILNVAVAPGMQRQGIGATLIGFVRTEAQRNGMRDIFLEVRVSNLPAITLYKRYGFADVAIRKRYYVDGEDAMVMHCHIPDMDAETDAPESKSEATGTDNLR